MGGISGDLIPQCEAKKNREERWQMGTSVWTNLVLEEDGNIEITGQFAVEYSLVQVSQLHTEGMASMEEISSRTDMYACEMTTFGEA